jgi:hypothetical protein
VDVSGVGEGIADLLETYEPSSVKMTRCQFVASERLDRKQMPWRVGKALARVEALLAAGDGPGEAAPDASGRSARRGAARLRAPGHRVGLPRAEARTGAHEDLVTALGLATLEDGDSLVASYSKVPVIVPPDNEKGPPPVATGGGGPPNTAPASYDASPRERNNSRVPRLEDHPTLSLDEVCSILKIGRTVAYSALACGQIPDFKVGRRYIVPTAEIRRILGLEVG